MKQASATIDGVEYADDIDNLEINPTTQTSTFTPISGRTVSDVAAATWAATMNVAQDFTDGSLWMLCFDHEGEEKEVIFKPKGVQTGMPSIKAKLVLSPGKVGGAPGAQTAQITAAVREKPTIVAETATPVP